MKLLSSDIHGQNGSLFLKKALLFALIVMENDQRLIELFSELRKLPSETEWIDKLPGVFTLEQKKNKIGNLLTKLRKSGAIINAGSRTAPRWGIIKKE